MLYFLIFNTKCVVSLLLVELYHEPGAVAARLRRLHLVIVDLRHPRKTVTKIEKKFHRQITCVRDTRAVSITPIPLWDNEAWRSRYVFGKNFWMTLINLSF